MADIDHRIGEWNPVLHKRAEGLRSGMIEVHLEVAKSFNQCQRARTILYQESLHAPTGSYDHYSLIYSTHPESNVVAGHFPLMLASNLRKQSRRDQQQALYGEWVNRSMS